jgi:hypothetical protein
VGEGQGEEGGEEGLATRNILQSQYLVIVWPIKHCDMYLLLFARHL